MRSLRLPLLLLTATVISCGRGDTVMLNGAGATFPYILYAKWIIDYNRVNPEVQVNYQSIGSGGGVSQFMGGTVDFGGTDGPMSDEEIASVNGNVMHLPTILGAVVPTYNLPAVTEQIRFTPAVLADIYLGRITRWNDARIQSVNPGIQLPDMPIVVVHRSDGSGTTFVWVDYLTKVSPEWASRVGRGRAVNWPTGIGGRGNEGVAATVRQTTGAIGYVELGYALINNMPSGAVRNREGNFVSPTIEAVTAAAEAALGALPADTDFRVSITDGPGAEAFPISSLTWVLVRRDYGDEADKARELVRFLNWGITDGQADGPALGYAPLPASMIPLVQDRLRQIQAGGAPVWSGD